MNSFQGEIRRHQHIGLSSAQPWKPQHRAVIPNAFKNSRVSDRPGEAANLLNQRFLGNYHGNQYKRISTLTNASADGRYNMDALFDQYQSALQTAAVMCPGMIPDYPP
jgi:hypothetical protein